MVIQTADKGHTIVILDKISYITAIEEILNDHTKFSKLDIPAGKEINYITNLEKRITSDHKLLKMKKLLIRLLIRTLIQLGLDQVFYTGYEKCTRRRRMDYHLSVRFCQILVCLPAN